MGIRRRTRRIRRWYRRNEHSSAMLAIRLIVLAGAAAAVAVLVLQAM